MVESRKDHYRKLSENEISLLISRGCSAEDWRLIEVKDNFNPDCFSHTRFSGRVKLGVFNKTLSEKSGVKFSTGISHATIHNCIIGDNASIFNVHEFLSNYIIDNDVVIRNCNRICCDDISTFGNGTILSVLDESGGRSVRIFDRLSSQLACIYALYRHRPGVIEKIDKMILGYAANVSSGMGFAGKGSVITNCGLIRNVRMGEYSMVEGALKLEEGSLLSTRTAPVFIGYGVIMSNFIVCSGARITESAIINRCFVGEGSILAKQFSSSDTLFFSNCQGFNGEAVSVFAGPYTVTHHKSTLLIAGMFSFTNAGSGTNQSNHHYKLGPFHHGIVDRGSKTASDSYLLWPSHIGPFSLVAGHHLKNFDTSGFPFSYVVEQNGETFVHPALNLRNCGTFRDVIKWPERDRRSGPDNRDIINLSLFNPYTAGKILTALEILQNLPAEPHTNEDFRFDNFKIKAASVRKGIDLYKAGLKKYTGEIILKRLSGKNFTARKELSELLECSNGDGTGEWTDLAGLIAPVNRINDLLDEIESVQGLTLEEIENRFRKMNSDYDELEWSWVSDLIKQITGRKPVDLNPSEILGIIEEWQEAETMLHNLIMEDARKEFSSSSMTGFGAGLGKKAKEKDFKAVRGYFETNPFIVRFENELRDKLNVAQGISARLKSLVQ